MSLAWQAVIVLTGFSIAIPAARALRRRFDRNRESAREHLVREERQQRITSIDSVGVPVTTRPLIDPVGGHSGALAQPRVHPPE